MLHEDPAPSDAIAHPERGAWDAVRSGWRQLYGNFDRLGVSIEAHDFPISRRLDWARSFHDDSVEFCLNLSGSGEIRSGRHETVLAPRSAAVYAIADGAIAASRGAGEQHRFFTVELSRQFITRQLESSADRVEPTLREAVFSGKPKSAVSDARPMSTAQQALVATLANPPVAPAALPLWYQSKLLELMAEFCFRPEEMFCTMRKRLARERAERVCEILSARITEPPTLEELGREIGVSQFHLSRAFSEQMGMTIPQFIRRIRMERAAELLRDGRHNVTEAAFAVGYASLGHFSRSFCEVIGCCPALYPNARTLLQKRA